MKFNVNEGGAQFEPTVGTYTVPVSGYYRVESRMIEYIDTNTYQLILNPNKKWYQFWKPSFISQKVFIPKESNSGIQVKFYYAGAEIPVSEQLKAICRIS